MRLTYSDFVDLDVCSELKPKLRVIVAQGCTPRELVARVRKAGIIESDIMWVGAQLATLEVCKIVAPKIERLGLGYFLYDRRYRQERTNFSLDCSKYSTMHMLVDETDPRPVDMLLDALEALDG